MIYVEFFFTQCEGLYLFKLGPSINFISWLDVTKALLMKMLKPRFFDI